MRPGTACACNSVLRVPSNCKRLGEVLELQGSHVGAVDGHLSLDVFQLHVGAAALQIDLALDVGGADHFAAADLQERVAADAREPHVAVVAGQFHVARDVADLVIAGAAARLDAHAAGHGDFQIVGDPLVVGRAILVGADQQPVALRHDFHRRVLVGAVGILAGPGANHFVAVDGNLLRISADDLDAAARIFKGDAVHARRRAVRGDGVVVLLPEHVQALRVEVDSVLVGLPDHRPRDADHDHQHHFAAGEAGVAVLPPDGDFDQPEQAPPDQQEGPVTRHQVEDRGFRMHIVPQEQAADDQEQQRPGERSSSHMASPEGGVGPGSVDRGGALDPNPPFAGPEEASGGAGVEVAV